MVSHCVPLPTVHRPPRPSLLACPGNVAAVGSDEDKAPARPGMDEDLNIDDMDRQMDDTSLIMIYQQLTNKLTNERTN